MELRIVLLAASCSPLLGCHSSRGENAASTSSTTEVSTAPSDVSTSSTSGTTEETTGAPGRSWCLVPHIIDAADGTLDDVADAPRLADVDGDGLPELWTVVTMGEDAELTQYHVEPTGLAITGGIHVLDGHPEFFADIDGDGHDDALVFNFGAARREWIDVSTGTPGVPQVLEAPERIVAWYDVDGDGDADAFNDGWPDFLVELWLNDGSGALTLASQLEPDDFNLNVLEDVLPIADGVFAASTTNEAIGFGVGYGGSELRFAGGTLANGAQTQPVDYRLDAATDFDLDGRADFVTHGDGLTVWHGSATAASPIVLSELYGTVDVGDFMGLGAPAMMVVGGSGIELLTDPLDPTQAPVAVVGEPVDFIHVVDFDGDGKAQLIDMWKEDDGGAAQYRLLDVRPCQ